MPQYIRSADGFADGSNTLIEISVLLKAAMAQARREELRPKQRRLKALRARNYAAE
eukprot:CAMPEP_0117563420 /NCGR_PEP_ID=MMETSP0784-20121206/55487_1 /TAXON_ID=39447 /ORGANISM="" /LENGTH=55 /DNA_ID=CAMNT_0005361069 /DNA_START=166 /DNA_END=333 /DNA_ORIENTATION=-